MGDETTANGGWFEGVERGDPDAARDAIETGRAEVPTDWPRLAVESGFATDEDDYYTALHDATLLATREAVRARERADDQQLIHAVRAMDDCERTANELAERLQEWAGSLFEDGEPRRGSERSGQGPRSVGTGVEGVRRVADRDPTGPAEERAVALARRVVGLVDEADEIRTYVERTSTEVAPNLSTLAGPVLAARLIALAGGLESLAKKPSGTVQVLGAEDALFAHLAGRAPSPKHGVIFTHEYVRGTRPEDRGSAARALAGKLSIAARVDHYRGEFDPEIERQLEERMATIRARGEDA